MVWQECSAMDSRIEFVQLAEVSDCNISLLCRRFGISRKTGYKWLKRYRLEGIAGLKDHSRAPQTINGKTVSQMEREVLKVRTQHPSWGGRKIHRRLHDLRTAGAFTVLDDLLIPSPSTVTRILRRNNRIKKPSHILAKSIRRFQRSNPNELWQMDYKGDVRLTNRSVSHPLTILDDHSRFNLCLQSCDNQQFVTLKHHLTAVFQQYGMPLAILCDNGVPWGSSFPAVTRFGLWLMRLGIQLIHGRPFHPQTQGKEERFHRTLKTEVLKGRFFPDYGTLQQAFDSWRTVYNYERPHEALDYDTPGSRYTVSERDFPGTLPELLYDECSVVRKVNNKGTFSFKNRTWKISKAFYGERVAIYPTTKDSVYSLAYATFRIGEIHMKDMDGKTQATVRMFRSSRDMKLIKYPCGKDIEKIT
jgi:transposase InsO family protein